MTDFVRVLILAAAIAIIWVIIEKYARHTDGQWCPTCRKYRWFTVKEGGIVTCEKCGNIPQHPTECPKCGHETLYKIPDQGRAECNRWTCKKVVYYGL